MALACITLLGALLLMGAAIDIRSRRLPNWLTASVAGLYIAYAALSPSTVDWLTALPVAGAVFAIGFAIFAFNLMGGGDVKLMSGLALWAGVDFIALFLLVTGIAGGLMSVGMLVARRVANHPLAIAFWPFVSVALSDRLGLALPFGSTKNSPSQAEHDENAGSIPYGVAIAAGGFFVIHALLEL
jgi:prepilin peptidase CpaA